ncbi:hypothetical protein L228DRAFT_6514 [Xylona heveae TC161]|uniref:Uncharacterized protein n=1 Tax=Xylona heveae (strain CBS 132557 / TC161) TaxID=1328760 RepID=A0A165JF69_XYLHT|nr:hypothetical protein L228DRAFT_6514 [Xylona heveae TC161]KZF26156.1 hypothetical protein L228DRAFT_6514 [Xylona heveae TC161]
MRVGRETKGDRSLMWRGNAWNPLRICPLSRSRSKPVSETLSEQIQLRRRGWFHSIMYAHRDDGTCLLLGKGRKGIKSLHNYLILLYGVGTYQAFWLAEVPLWLCLGLFELLWRVVGHVLFLSPANPVRGPPGLESIWVRENATTLPSSHTHTQTCTPPPPHYLAPPCCPALVANTRATGFVSFFPFPSLPLPFFFFHSSLSSITSSRLFHLHLLPSTSHGLEQVQLS